MERRWKKLISGAAAVLMAVCMMMSGMSVSAASSGYIESSSGTAMSRLAKGAEDLESHRSFRVYNFQGGSGYDFTMSKNDVSILKAFAKEHFTSSMSAAQKAAYTMQWIHSNVTYASNAAAWNKIAGKSWVEAIFTYKTGQCAQYNGALACMMAYLGYDSSLVQGYRTSSSGSKWQHFWAQVKIGGTTYLMEAGNYGKSGKWYYLCAKYSETKGYVY